MKKNNNYYFSFKMRIICLMILIIVFFGLGIYLLFGSFNYGYDYIRYSEVSKVSYNVCDSCLNFDMVSYNSEKVDKINSNIEYNVDFSSDIDYDLSYDVEVSFTIYDKYNKENILYKNKEMLVDDAKIGRLNKKIHFNESVDIDYKKYNDFFSEYKEKYLSNVEANVKVILYLNEISGRRKVASMVIPVGVNPFKIKTYEINNQNKLVKLDKEILKDNGNISLFFGCFLLIISTLFSIMMFRLVSYTFKKKNAYELKLNKILKEYDDYIVNAVSDYNYDKSKMMIKVSDIKELVDVCKIINKPIIYNRINNIKSEFIVEDIDKVYKYNLKNID